MNRRLRLLLVVAATIAFAWLLSRVGIDRLATDALDAGWIVLPVVGLYGLVCCLSAAAWQILMSDEPGRPPFHVTFATYVSGLALNFLTPLINAGGEPYKIAELSRYLGPARATGAVILHTMLKAMSFLLVWCTALLLGLWFLPHKPALVAAQASALALAALLATLIFVAHRRGGLEWLLDRLHRTPGMRRVAPMLERHRAFLTGLDRQITGFYHRQPTRFWRALALQYLSRGVFFLQFCLIAAALGLRLGYPQAFLIGGLEQLATNLAFFVPYELGTREGMHYVLWGWLGFDPAVGVFAAIVDRVRDILWIATGVALTWVAQRGAARAPDVRAAEEHS